MSMLEGQPEVKLKAEDPIANIGAGSLLVAVAFFLAEEHFLKIYFIYLDFFF